MSRVLVIGAGGLGGPAVLGLAIHGRHHFTLVDDDRVDATNLSRQLFFGEDDVGRWKATALAEALSARFPLSSFEPVVTRLERENGPRLVRTHDLVVDASDNFPTRFLMNDLCVEARRPFVHGAALRWLGQALAVAPGRTPCLRCIFEGEPPPGSAPTCAEAGVAAPLVGLVGQWMADAGQALLSSTLGPWDERMRTIDGWAGRERWVPIGRDPVCPSCALLF
jgi:molybdopterin/thiamine biosynthesis adenylyltransferase